MNIFSLLIYRTVMMKKNKKQPSETPVMSETPRSQISYVRRHERLITYRRTIVKIQKRPSLIPVRPVTPVSQVRYFIRYELHTCFLRTTEKIKNHPPPSPPSPPCPAGPDNKLFRYGIVGRTFALLKPFQRI